MVNSVFKTNLPLFHHAIIPLEGDGAALEPIIAA
jgi:hypothetical protein